MRPGKAPPSTKSFSCTSCGAPINLRAPNHTERVACEYCGALLDAQDPDLKIIEKYERKFKYKPLIPLGTRGRIRGDKWEAIGYQRRQIVVDGQPYSWSEYLLFNPYKGFRWLAEYDGHWTFVKNTKGNPTQADGSGLYYNYMNRRFVHFQNATATTTFVVGEFYWKVQVGQRSQISDFICPPYTLSQDRTDSEIVWTLGEYIDPHIVWKSFGLKGIPQESFGVAPAQVSPFQEEWGQVKWIFGFFGLMTLLAFFLSIGLSANKKVHQQSFVYDKTQVEKSKISRPFKLEGRTSNLEVETYAPLKNSWLYLRYALIRQDGSGGAKPGETTAIDFGRDLSYYSGSGWSEGTRTDTVILPSIPSGTYVLRVEPEPVDPKLVSLEYTVVLNRDVPRPGFFFLTLILLVIPLLIYSYRVSSFEARRWLESDYPQGPLVPYGEAS